MQNRTLTQLLSEEKRVWLYFRNKGIWQVFCEQAHKEGFLWANGREVSEVEYDSIVAVNQDMTFNYVGFCGHLCFRNTHDTDRLKIDFAKYINGADDYIYGC